MARTRSSRQQVVGITTKLELLGAPFQLEAHFGVVRGRMACVGIDLRAFTSDTTIRNAQLLEGAEELNSPRWRALPVGSQIETLRQLLVDMGNASLKYPEASGVVDEAVRADLKTALEGLESQPKRRRGRTPTLSDAELERVVRPAYLQGGRTPVQAVRVALENHGTAGAGPTGEVTIDQARKAVARARSKGLLPKPAKKGKP